VWLVYLPKEEEEEGSRERPRERERERGTTQEKLTIAMISECHFCFYPVRSGNKCGVLQKLLLMGEVQWRVHTDT